MKTTVFAIALLMSGAAIAQTTTDADVDVSAQTDVQTGDVDVNADMDATADVDTSADVSVGTDMNATTTSHTTATHSMASTMPSTADAISQPGNANPERDARGIAVISDPAIVPSGWNGVAATGMGGPLVDPATGQTMASDDTSYPPCTAEVTDNCVQAYVRGGD